LPGGDNMKGTYTEELLNKLKSIGVPAHRAEEADIEISTTFTDAKWTAGNKVIKYHGMISFNESEKTIFMYEKTSESSSGISFSGGMESSFQSGKTLFRKVKTVAYGLDGKAFEVDLDLGAIPKTVKEYGKQIGWKFKTVLSTKKARSTGPVVPIVGVHSPHVSTAYSDAQPTSAHVDVSETSSANTQSVADQSVLPPKPSFKPTFPKVKGHPIISPLGLIFPSATLLVVLAVMWLSETSIIGMGLSVVLIGAGYYGQIHRAWLLKIIIWAAVLVLVFSVYIFTTDFSSSSQGFSNNTSSFDFENAVYSKEIFNLGSDATYMIGANDLSDYKADKIIHELKLMAFVYQDVLINSLEGNERIVEIRLTDFEWIKAPKLGTLANLSTVEGLNVEFDPVVKGNDVVYNTDAFSQTSSGWSNTLCFQFELVDIGTYQYPDGFSGTSSYLISAQNLGISAEDLSMSFKYRIIAKMANGREYVSETIVDAINGDFLYGSTSPWISSRVFDYTQGKQFADYK